MDPEERRLREAAHAHYRRAREHYAAGRYRLWKSESEKGSQCRDQALRLAFGPWLLERNAK